MRKYLGQFVSDFEKQLNHGLLNKDADMPLVEYVKDAWKSLEIVKNIEILKFEFNQKESDIDVNRFIFKREKKKKKKDRCDYKMVDDDRCGCLTVWIRITVEEQENGKEPEVKQKIFKKEMLIPLQDEDGYYFIKGKKYYIIYQLVDKSTYTSSSSVTLKSLMPIATKRTSIKTEEVIKTISNKSDVIGNEYNLPVYNVFVFKKEIPCILFYLANGIDWALDYLGVHNVISFVEKPDESEEAEKFLYFYISSKCYVKVYRDIFLKYPYVQSIVGGLLHVSTNRITIPDLSDKDIWIRKLSNNNNNIDKGKDTLVAFNRLLDETTKKILMVSNHDKTDIYAILRWIMMNFNDLRMKDNLSLYNKRLRCNEYIASLLTYEFSLRLNRVITLGAKATMQNFLDMFKFSGSLLIQRMHNSGILRFDDCINDMDFFTKCRYTTKGPNSLGGKNSNNISIRFRGIHPSMLGNIDLLVCGNSDPGTSGVLSPFSNINGLYFSEDKEPDDVMYNLAKDISELMKKEGVEYIALDCECKEDYYKVIDALTEFNDKAITVSGVSRNQSSIIIESAEDIIDIM